MTTWSPVGAAFNTKTHRRLNLFEKKGVCISLSLDLGALVLRLIVQLLSRFSSVLTNTTGTFFCFCLILIYRCDIPLQLLRPLVYFLQNVFAQLLHNSY